LQKCNNKMQSNDIHLFFGTHFSTIIFISLIRIAIYFIYSFNVEHVTIRTWKKFSHNTGYEQRKII
jgi:hypothetical protein